MLTITNADDYKYLDRLVVSDTSLGDYGGLYLQYAPSENSNSAIS